MVGEPLLVGGEWHVMLMPRHAIDHGRAAALTVLDAAGTLALVGLASVLVRPAVNECRQNLSALRHVQQASGDELRHTTYVAGRYLW